MCSTPVAGSIRLSLTRSRQENSVFLFCTVLRAVIATSLNEKTSTIKLINFLGSFVYFTISVIVWAFKLMMLNKLYIYIKNKYDFDIVHLDERVIQFKSFSLALPAEQLFHTVRNVIH